MRDGLEAAVRDGVIDRATAERLAPYLAGSAPAPEDADPDDEKLQRFPAVLNRDSHTHLSQQK
jgi:hypothetical protein